MRRWLNASVGAATHVADRSGLWLSGALGWMVTVGWIALIVGVARPATDAALTFFGAGIVTSGAWPWNGLAILLAVLVVVAAAIALASIAEAVLLRGHDARAADVRAIFVVGLICVLPLAVATLAFALALVVVAPGEFNAPESEGSSLLRTVIALAPFAAAMLLAATIGSAIHAAAIRGLAGSDRVLGALASAPRRLGRAGTAAIAQALALLVARIGYLVLAAILLRVLWGPIEVRLASEGFGAAVIGLLVGFVAIWLCLVVAGGALHAWGSVSWTRLLEAREGEAVADPQLLERGTRT